MGLPRKSVSRERKQSKADPQGRQPAKESEMIARGREGKSDMHRVTKGREQNVSGMGSKCLMLPIGC